ncbi:MAG: aminotransferase class IV [Pseudomonadota bacterium]
MFDVSDRGLLLADGIFTTALVVRGRVAFREQHIQRLLTDAQALGISIQRSRIEEAFDRNLDDTAQAALRVTVTRGGGHRGISPSPNTEPTVLATCRPIAMMNRAPPVRLTVSSIRRNETSLTSRHKTLSYLDNILALEAAKIAGYDDSIFLNTIGNVTCATTANIIAIFGKKIVVPPIEDGALAGITSAFVIRNANKFGLKAVSRSISHAEIQLADQIFLTNSLRGIVPVAAINNRKFDWPALGGLLGAWREAVGLGLD